MKKSATTFILILLVALGWVGNAFAQAPEGIIYQAEARDSRGKTLNNTALDVEISIKQGSFTGYVVYEELHNVVTSNNGMFVLIIGQGTNPTGLLENVEWGNYSHFLNVRVKEPKSNVWTDMGTTQLLSVPYALHSKTAETFTGTINETDPSFTAWDKSSGISITESQIRDLGSYLQTESDPAVTANFDFTDAATGDLLQYSGTKWVKVTPDYISDYTVTESDVIAHQAALTVTESQISDLGPYLEAETDPRVPYGTQSGDMQYWNGSAWVMLAATPNEGAALQMISGVPTWIGGTPPPSSVTSHATGKTWMDRNLGASQVATSSADAASYGDLYQWGRGTDGHEKRTSGTTSTLSVSDTPGHGNFIVATNSPWDWRSPQNDNLWQGVSGVNNPCPQGYRLPTDAELDAERASWSSQNSAGAFASPLKLPVAGYRRNSYGSLNDVGSGGYYWSSTVDGTYSRFLAFASTGAGMYLNHRAIGYSVRCLKD